MSVTPEPEAGHETDPRVADPEPAPDAAGLEMDPMEGERTTMRGQPSPEARRLARRLFWGATGLLLVAIPVLSLAGGLPLVDSILLALLLAAAPGFAIAQVPLVEGVAIERLPVYWSSIITLWLLGAVCWLVGARSGGPEALGLVPLAPGPMVVWSLGLAAAGIMVIAVFHILARWIGIVDSPLLEELLPRTARERRLFAILSVAAGVGEELAYRGYAIPTLSPVLGVTGAAVVSTAVFGAVHAYQGALGVARTALMGGILAGGFLASGSLWPPIIAHTLIDLIAGIALGDRLLVTSAAESS